MENKRKIEVPVDKHEWHPSPLPGQVVLVTTVDSQGEPNVAPKSWISMAAFGPPAIVMFGCSLDHATAKNALAAGEFVINIPGKDLAATCWAVGGDGKSPRAGRFERHGLTPIPSLRVRPPRVAECRAHIECALEGTREWGKEIVLFGRVAALTIDESLRSGGSGRKAGGSGYGRLAPFFFLEEGLAAPLGAPFRVEQ